MGYTLIELLVVIGIIAILASLLLPALSQAREKSKGIKCSGNLRQIGSALSLYIDDHNEFYPFGYYNNTAWSATNFAPQQLLLPYFNETRICFCPTNKDPEVYNWWRYGGHADFTAGSSYMFSENAMNYSLALSKVVKPDTFGYASEGHICPNGWDWATLDPHRGLTGWWDVRVHWDHQNLLNVLWGDSHVSSIQRRGAGQKARSDPLVP